MHPSKTLVPLHQTTWHYNPEVSTVIYMILALMFNTIWPPFAHWQVLHAHLHPIGHAWHQHPMQFISAVVSQPKYEMWW